MRIIWKIYFWLFLVTLAIAYVGEVVTFLQSPTALTVIAVDLVISIPAYLILWAFVFDKKVFAQPFLKVYAVLYFCWELAVNIVIYPYAFQMPMMLFLPDFIYNLPEYAGIALYCFMNKRA